MEVSDTDDSFPATGDKKLCLDAMCCDVNEKVERARKEGLQHFSHEHALIFKEGINESDSDGDGEIFACNGCGLMIKGSAYGCLVNCHFYLHEFCALIPNVIEHHPEHPEHPLTLISELPPPNSEYICDVCNKEYSYSSVFTYRCDLCQFEADLRCASQPLHIHDPFHDHVMKPWLHPASFVCGGCGDKHEEGISFVCSSCCFWVHEQCLLLQHSIKHNSHVHSLKLTCKENPSSNSRIFMCAICEEQILGNVRFYACEACHFHYVHVKCLTKTRANATEAKVEEKNLVRLPLHEVPRVLVMRIQFIMQMCRLGQEKRAEVDNSNVFHHFSHHHPLMLHDDDKQNDKKLWFEFGSKSSVTNAKEEKLCEACVLPILGLPYYGCSHSCNFYLHKWCAELPNELWRPCHPGHKLILVGKPVENFGFLRCKGCGHFGNGFFFKCAKCKDYYLDVRCASLPGSVMHETHEHPLVLKNRRAGGCAACGHGISGNTIFCYNCNFGPHDKPDLVGLSFGCNTCHFSLHVECAQLPRVIRHWYDEHPFALVYSATKDGDGGGDVDEEAFCEFCEGMITRYMWFYRCAECDRHAGVDCASKATGLISPIKHGGIYDSPNHPHHLTCVPASYKWTKPCNRCGMKEYVGSSAFECALCKVMFDLKCACPPSPSS